MIHALYAFQASPHLFSYSCAILRFRCALLSSLALFLAVFVPTAEVTSGDKYDSSHALKQESYLSLRGVHSALKL
jgi:hypothetical protein